MKTVRELSSLKELKLSSGTILCCARKGLGEVVKECRDYHYYLLWGPFPRSEAWKDELTNALNRAGYIRHDITPKTFVIAKLYWAIYGSDGRHDLSELPRCYEDLDTNEAYENFQAISNEKIGIVLKELDSRLSDLEEEILFLRFGLCDGQVRTLAEIAKAYGMNSARVRQIESKALRKLRAGDLLPDLKNNATG